MSGPDANSSAGVATGVFQISPSNVTGLNGAQLVISCYADSNPTEVRWTVDGRAVNSSDSLQIGYSDGEGVITFSPLGYQHEGVYRCTAYGGSGGEQFASYPGRVRVYGERAGATVLRGGVPRANELPGCARLLPPRRSAWFHYSALPGGRAPGRNGCVHLRRWQQPSREHLLAVSGCSLAEH